MTYTFTAISKAHLKFEPSSGAVSSKGAAKLSAGGRCAFLFIEWLLYPNATRPAPFAHKTPVRHFGYRDSMAKKSALHGSHCKLSEAMDLTMNLAMNLKCLRQWCRAVAQARHIAGILVALVSAIDATYSES
jgi:hypothetical protein